MATVNTDILSNDCNFNLPCVNEATCLPDGSCDCSPGTEGERCEVLYDGVPGLLIPAILVLVLSLLWFLFAMKRIAVLLRHKIYSGAVFQIHVFLAITYLALFIATIDYNGYFLILHKAVSVFFSSFALVCLHICTLSILWFWKDVISVKVSEPNIFKKKLPWLFWILWILLVGAQILGPLGNAFGYQSNGLIGGVIMGMWQLGTGIAFSILSWLTYRKVKEIEAATGKTKATKKKKRRIVLYLALLGSGVIVASITAMIVLPLIGEKAKPILLLCLTSANFFVFGTCYFGILDKAMGSLNKNGNTESETTDEEAPKIKNSAKVSDVELSSPKSSKKFNGDLISFLENGEFVKEWYSNLKSKGKSNLLAYLALDEMLGNKDTNLVQNAVAIYKRYICEGSPNQISLNEKLRKQLRENMEPIIESGSDPKSADISISVFKKVQKKAYKDLNERYTEFKETKEYSKIISFGKKQKSHSLELF